MISYDFMSLLKDNRLRNTIVMAVKWYLIKKYLFHL